MVDLFLSAPVVIITSNLNGIEGEYLDLNCSYKKSGIPKGNTTNFFYNGTVYTLTKVRIMFKQYDLQQYRPKI